LFHGPRRTCTYIHILESESLKWISFLSLQCLSRWNRQPDEVLCWRWTSFLYTKKVFMCSDWATKLPVSKLDWFCNFVSWIWWPVDSHKSHTIFNLVVMLPVSHYYGLYLDLLYLIFFVCFPHAMGLKLCDSAVF